MIRAADGKAVTAADYLGKVVLLYFGYTFCPDVCPATLLNLSMALRKLGRRRESVRNPVRYSRSGPRHPGGSEAVRQFVFA